MDDCDFDFSRQAFLYIVVAEPARHGACSLHGLTAPYVLTPNPKAGDKIHAVLEGAEYCKLHDGRARVVGLRYAIPGRLTGHAGRRPLLGEDQVAAREDVLADVLPELYPEPYTARGWNYVPVSFEDGAKVYRSWGRDTDGFWVEDQR